MGQRSNFQYGPMKMKFHMDDNLTICVLIYQYLKAIWFATSIERKIVRNSVCEKFKYVPAANFFLCIAFKFVHGSLRTEFDFS